MTTYKPYHYHALLGLGYALAFAAAIYLSLQPDASPILFALWGYALRCVWYHHDQFNQGRSACRMMERILKQDRREEEEKCHG